MGRSLAAVLADLRGGPSFRVLPGAQPLEEIEVVDVTVDSREVRPGSVFCCVRGERVDGHSFAAAAVAAGAVALVVETELGREATGAGPDGGVVPQILVPASRTMAGWLAASCHGHPDEQLDVIGVTGTNGKTTTAQLIGAVLRSAGRRVEVLGTLSGRFTTPEAPVLHRQFAAWLAEGVDTVVMEVSSHALVLDRVAGVHFDVAAFTNLGRDHLDLHGTVERYFAAKAQLFEPALSRRGVVNRDDVHGRLLLDTAAIPLVGCSASDLDDVVVGPAHHAYRWRGVEVEVPLGGRYNVDNSLLAAECCVLLGLTPAEVATGLRSAPPVAGRLEPVAHDGGFTVLVDYAHTPDGLTVVLDAVRAAAGDGRVIVVFGCGGDRDRAKRPEMGEIAARLADVAVVTSDNPRSEDPLAIIDAIVEGVPPADRSRIVIEPDRRAAIRTAIRTARPGDVVLIAGKGHETTQTIGDRVLPFDDRAVAREEVEVRT